MRGLSIAIDGPSGAGKSTMAKKLASQLGFVYVDTGAMYRGVGLYILRKGIESTDTESIVKCLGDIVVTIEYIGGEQRIMLNGEDVSNHIRTEEVGKYASDCSAVPAVRAHLLNLQRGMRAKSSIIMDGRDIGTVILPDADLKIFLVASLDDRATRRYNELIERGTPSEYSVVYNQIEQRDENDRNRKVAPLKAADDAVLVDTTGVDVDTVYSTLLTLVKERLQDVL